LEILLAVLKSVVMQPSVKPVNHAHVWSYFRGCL